MRPSPQVQFNARSVQPIRLPTEVTIRLTPFDQREYRRLVEARAETIRRVLRKLKPALGLRTALDAGCGVGFFSQTLRESGLHAIGFDAREGNIDEARTRFPEILFEQGDIENDSIVQLGRFDLVLCFGLLYHLENPMRAIRNLQSMTAKCMLLESMCVPGEKPALLMRDEPRQADQSVSDVACYPSEGSLVKMLYRAGFAKVYRVTSLPDHADFRETQDWARRRTVLLASYMPVEVSGFRLILEPHEICDPWDKKALLAPTLGRRVRRFLASPARRKYVTLANRVRRIFPNLPIPLRLPFGAWWFAHESEIDNQLLYDEFEPVETHFVKRLLRRDMTAVDVGAHHGWYTLLASKRVGWHGRVVAIEPSARECIRLERHLRLNRCSNVQLVNCAVGEDPGESDLHLVEGSKDGCNSLRTPAVNEPVRTVPVQVRRLDDILEELKIERVDFLKLDVEGAELHVLYGAMKLLNRKSRPAMLVEVQDVRTEPWGYAAREILQFLIRMDYRWFTIAGKGALLPVNCGQATYDANLVALPLEREEEFLEWLGQK